MATGDLGWRLIVRERAPTPGRPRRMRCTTGKAVQQGDRDRLGLGLVGAVRIDRFNVRLHQHSVPAYSTWVSRDRAYLG